MDNGNLLQRCKVRDLIPTSKRTKTDRGYLIAPATLGRCGVQVYSRGELGLDGDANATVRLMRVPDEVFRPQTIASFENVPITNDHPPEGVDAKNWPEVAIGHVRDISRGDGDLLIGTTYVMDGEGVEAIEAGKTATSCGYSFDLDMTSGIAPDGQEFDGYQRNILGDHLSIVGTPRGGPICRIGDNKKEGKSMGTNTRKIAVDGLPPFEIDELAAGAIEGHVKKVTDERNQAVADLAGHKKSAADALSAKDATIAEKDKTIAAKDAEISDVKAKLAKAEAIDVDALVTERSAVIADAKKLAPELEPKGSSHEIRKAAIAEAIKTSDSMKLVLEGICTDGLEKATEAQVKATMKVMLGMSHDALRTAQDRAVAGAIAGTSNSTARPTGNTVVVDMSTAANIHTGAEGFRG